MKIKNIQFDKDKLFFTSDTHFYHSNIIKYCDRPFKNAHEMNDILVDNWNSVISKNDIVFHLGDFSLTAQDKNVVNLLDRLNGIKFLVIGNHEKDVLSNKIAKNRFVDIVDVAEIFVKDEEITYKEQHIFMSHYPHICWNGSHRGSWNLFGHVHGGLSNKGVIQHSPTALDVGVDSHNYFPISYQEVKELITKQSLKK